MIFFHPLVAEPAQPLFEARKYRQAVNDAATHVNDAPQKRLGRYDLSDSDLMGKGVHDRPREGGPIPLALSAATRTTWPPEVIALGLALAAGLMATDDARRDTEPLIMVALADIE